MTDPRVDKLGNSAILTDTQFRIAFAPRDEKAKIVALKADVRQTKTDQLSSMMALGMVYIQVKAAFGIERTIALTPPEVVILMDLFDKFITELPKAE